MLILAGKYAGCTLCEFTVGGSGEVYVFSPFKVGIR